MGGNGNDKPIAA